VNQGQKASAVKFGVSVRAPNGQSVDEVLGEATLAGAASTAVNLPLAKLGLRSSGLPSEVAFWVEYAAPGATPYGVAYMPIRVPSPTAYVVFDAAFRSARVQREQAQLAAPQSVAVLAGVIVEVRASSAAQSALSRAVATGIGLQAVMTSEMGGPPGDSPEALAATSGVSP
jgi:hypothetical protein